MFTVTHFVLFDDMRGCSSETSFQTAISKRLEPHPATIETSGLQAIVLYFHIYAFLDFFSYILLSLRFLGNIKTI